MLDIKSQFKKSKVIKYFRLIKKFSRRKMNFFEKIVLSKGRRIIPHLKTRPLKNKDKIKKFFEYSLEMKTG